MIIPAILTPLFCPVFPFFIVSTIPNISPIKTSNNPKGAKKNIIQQTIPIIPKINAAIPIYISPFIFSFVSFYI